ncbi:MAG TPA: hypothetical protein VGM39_25950 [Kofleriaceae bacterium]|jgi:hypothetical protein
MKIKALIASVAFAVLGSAGVAAAAPRPVTAYRAPIATPVAYRPIHRPVQQRWTVLDSASGRTMRNVINVSSAKTFSKLEIKATQGSVAIDKVLVTFANGRTQTIDLDQRISAGSAGAQIDLNGNTRQITKIVVMAKGRALSSYQVLAA